MTSSYIKPEVVLAATHGLLERDIVLPALIWRDPVKDFAGAKGDAVTVKLPAYVKANKRALRSGSARSTTDRHQRSVVFNLDTDIYLDTPITDEELSLDIKEFGPEVLNPVVGGIVRQIEDEVYDVMEGAPYDLSITPDWSTSKATKETVARARRLLNQTNVPAGDRTLLIGTAVEENILTADDFTKIDSYSGASELLAQATIGALYGFRVVVSNLLDPEEAIAFHKTAFALSTFAPKVPDSIKWAARSAYNGIGIRHVKVTDTDEVADIFKTDAWTGSSHVYDYGTITGDVADGSAKFEPSEEPDIEDGTDKVFVRSVRIGGEGY